MDGLLATGGYEKKLRIFDLASMIPPSASNGVNTGANSTTGTDPPTVSADTAFEIAPGEHKGTIKAIVWTPNPNILVTAADDKLIRWFDLSTGAVIQSQPFTGEIGSCEFGSPVPGASRNDIGGGMPVLAIAAGKTVYFYGGQDARTLIKSVELGYEVASVALHPGQRKFVTGGRSEKDTWAKVYDFDTEEEIGKFIPLLYSALQPYRQT
jgi:serine-threonine kinase receptor-associated protein